jgi:hypothetical protein
VSNLESAEPFIARHDLEPEYGLIKLLSTIHIGNIDAGLQDSLDLWDGGLRHGPSVPQATLEREHAQRVRLFQL